MSKAQARVHVTAPFLPSPSLRVAILHVASWSLSFSLLPLSSIRIPFCHSRLSPSVCKLSDLVSRNHCRYYVLSVRRIEIRDGQACIVGHDRRWKECGRRRLSPFVQGTRHPSRIVARNLRASVSHEIDLSRPRDELAKNLFHARYTYLTGLRTLLPSAVPLSDRHRTVRF